MGGKIAFSLNCLSKTSLEGALKRIIAWKLQELAGILTNQRMALWEVKLTRVQEMKCSSFHTKKTIILYICDCLLGIGYSILLHLNRYF